MVNRMIKRKVAILFALTPFIIASCFAIFFWNHDSWSKKNVEEMKMQAFDLVYAINKYSSDTGRNPESLNSLVPNYVKKIDNPKASKTYWCYWPKVPRGGFILGFSQNETGLPPMHYYMSRTDTWQYDDGE
jgi:hypothetical protein